MTQASDPSKAFTDKIKSQFPDAVFVRDTKEVEDYMIDYEPPVVSMPTCLGDVTVVYVGRNASVVAGLVLTACLPAAEMSHVPELVTFPVTIVVREPWSKERVRGAILSLASELDRGRVAHRAAEGKDYSLVISATETPDTSGHGSLKKYMYYGSIGVTLAPEHFAETCKGLAKFIAAQTRHLKALGITIPDTN